MYNINITTTETVEKVCLGELETGDLFIDEDGEVGMVAMKDKFIPVIILFSDRVEGYEVDGSARVTPLYEVDIDINIKDKIASSIMKES